MITKIILALTLIYTIYMLYFFTRLLKTPKVVFKRKYSWVKTPTRATAGSAGFDFYNPENQISIPPNTMKIIDSMVYVALPKNFVMTVYPRSSLGIKQHLILANTVGVIDSDYTKDTIKIALYNYGKETITLHAGDRIAQGVITPYITDGKTVKTTRKGGLGSTGRR